MNIYKHWLNNPKFSLKLFVAGLVPFFLGVLIAFLAQWGLWQQPTLGWALIIIGVVVALPGYIGIWRWRWLKFKND